MFLPLWRSTWARSTSGLCLCLIPLKMSILYIILLLGHLVILTQGREDCEDVWYGQCKSWDDKRLRVHHHHRRLLQSHDGGSCQYCLVREKTDKYIFWPNIFRCLAQKRVWGPGVQLGLPHCPTIARLRLSVSSRSRSRCADQTQIWYLIKLHLKFPCVCFAHHFKSNRNLNLRTKLHTVVDINFIQYGWHSTLASMEIYLNDTT